MSAILRPVSLTAILTFAAALSPLHAATSPLYDADAPLTPARHGCGTWRQFQTPTGVGTSGHSARVAASEDDTIPKIWGRTLQTAHFALHYTLGKNIHQPTLIPADAALKTLRDSLHTAFAMPPSPTHQDSLRRDSTINTRLDSLGAPHPLYMQHAAAYFENAYAYYADTLGMRMPDSNIADFFQGTVLGKFNVDIADIKNLQGYEGTYGLTFKPQKHNGHLYSATMLVENDFIYGGSVSVSTGLVTGGAPIRVYEHGALLHDYGKDWDAGLAVTIAHEFYHAVQFEYTPVIPGDFHAWYELSAVAMEERLADTVNDYLGYLPTLLLTSRPVSIFSTGVTEDPNLNYANGIFHIFLSHTLGKVFDVAVWDRLRTNGNDLPKALLYAVAGQSQARMDSLYTAYAAALAIAGLPGSANSPLAFSPDFARWDRPRTDSALTSGVTSVQLPPLSYRLVKPSASAPTWALFKGIPGASVVSQSGTTFSSTFLQDSTLPVIANGTLALAVANSALDSTRTLTYSRGAASGANLTAFPNPATRAAAGIHFAALTSGSSAPLTVVSESGRRVATLTADPTGSFWNWNFRDTRNRALPSGVYYYGRSGDTPQTLLVLP